MSEVDLRLKIDEALKRSHHDGMLTVNLGELREDLVRIFIRADESSLNPNAGSDGRTTHYGSADDPYEVIKIIEHYGLGFHLGNALKYLLRSLKSGKAKRDLEKGTWYIERHLETQWKESDG